MAAVYPMQYKQFIQHKDVTDTVYASHVNDLQSEVVAIEQVLGVMPHQDTSLKMRVNTWASVGARLSAIQRGTGMPVIELFKGEDAMKATSNDLPKTIVFARPSIDPENLYDNTGFTTNRSGWWILTGAAMWTGGNGANGGGYDRSIGFAMNGANIPGIDLPPIGDGNSRMQAVWQGYIPAKTKVTFWVYHPLTGRTLSIADMMMSASMLREL